MKNILIAFVLLTAGASWFWHYQQQRQQDARVAGYQQCMWDINIEATSHKKLIETEVQNKAEQGCKDFWLK